jgi:predicted MFS family arabinose efflux permease
VSEKVARIESTPPIASSPRAGSLLASTVALLALRIVYAYNWFDVGPGLLGISDTFGVGPAEWGILLAAFLAGAAAGQIPAGLLSRRFGMRDVALMGALSLGAAAALAGLAWNFPALVVLRALAGIGAGLFFSPAIGLVGEINPEGRRGVAVGLFSSAFSIGAALGVYGTTLLVPSIGWRGSLAFGGLALVATTLVALPLLRKQTGGARAKTDLGLRWPVALRSAAVWAMGFAFLGLEGASVSAGQYFVPYAVQVHGWSPALAGVLASLFVFPSFFGGPVGGRIAERGQSGRAAMIWTTAISGLLLLAVPFATIPAAVAVVATAFSVAYGAVYAMMYVLARYLPNLPPDEVPLAIGLFNGVQIGGGAVASFGFGYLTGAAGYNLAWIALGALTVVPLVFLAYIPARIGGSTSATKS